MCSCHSIPECCVMFSGVKLRMGSFVLVLDFVFKLTFFSFKISFLCFSISSLIISKSAVILYDVF